MLVLALDTATPTLVAGIARRTGGDVEVLAERAVPSGNRQPAEHDELRWVTAAEARGLALAHPSYADLVGRLTGATGQ